MIGFNFKSSLVKRITLILITFFFLLIISITTLFYFNAQKIIKNELIDVLIPAEAKLVENNITSNIEPYIHISRALAHSEYIKNWLIDEKEAETGLPLYKKSQENLIKENNLFGSFLASFQTNTYYSKGAIDSKLEIEGKDSWLKYSLNSTKDYDVNMDYDRVTGSIALFINYKIYDDNQKLIAITGTASNVSMLADMIGQQKIRNTGYFFTINDAGIIQLHSNKDYILTKNIAEIDPGLKNTIQEALKSKHHIAYLNRESDGKGFVITAIKDQF